MNRYGITTDDMDDNLLLGRWRWLAPSSYRVLLASALGDLFLADDAGAAHWLDVGAGELTTVAENLKAFREAWEEDGNRDVWFGPGLVDALEAVEGRKPDECYSYIMLPILGGSFEPSNFVVRTLQQHLDGWGPIQQKLSSLPDGAQVTLSVEP